MSNTARISFLLVPLIAAFVLISRTQDSVPSAFNQTFQGYPCDDHCDQFQAGFETAETSHFTSNPDCQTLAEPLQLGCLSYLHEYRLEATQPTGYIFP